MIYENCKVVSAMDGDPEVSLCTVEIKEKIRVEYVTTIAEKGRSERRLHFYEGINLGTGHFDLIKRDKYGVGKASLHFESDSKSLVGFWTEDDQEGFWKIILGPVRP